MNYKYNEEKLYKYLLKGKSFNSKVKDKLIKLVTQYSDKIYQDEKLLQQLNLF
jgi:hypothetical protein